MPQNVYPGESVPTYRHLQHLVIATGIPGSHEIEPDD